MPVKKGKGKSKGKKKSKPNTPKKHMAGEFPLTEEQIAELKKVFNLFTKGSTVESCFDLTTYLLILTRLFDSRTPRKIKYNHIAANDKFYMRVNL